jgi:hypothetical protein
MGFLMYFAPELDVQLPDFPGPINGEMWQEYRVEMGGISANVLLRDLNASEVGTNDWLESWSKSLSTVAFLQRTTYFCRGLFSRIC